MSSWGRLGCGSTSSGSNDFSKINRKNDEHRKTKGEKTVKSLAKRPLAESSKKPSKKSQKEEEAELLRLNPQLKKIGELEKGIPIQVPEGFGRAADESVKASRGMAEELLRLERMGLTRLRDELKEHAARSAERCERVQAWLKSPQQRNCSEKPTS